MVVIRFHDATARTRLVSIHLRQVPNSIDPPLRGSIVARVEVSSHGALRAAIEPLLAAPS
jgi:hypothetical protein